MKRVDLKVGFACDNKCLFCVQGDKRQFLKQKSLDEIKTYLKNEYNKGIRAVVFTGGEPTLHKQLPESIKYASELGYISIQIQSNGRTFSDEKYLDSLIEAGANEFGPSLHGYKKETHDDLVGVKGAWEETVNGIINLRKRGKKIMTNSVITKQNYKELPNLAKLFCKLGVSQFQLAFIHIAGSADKNKNLIVPRKSDIMPYIKEALDIGKKNNVGCMTEAIPYCFMQGYEWAIAENIMPETAVYDGNSKMDSYINYRLNEGKIKRKECEKCTKFNECEGPWKEYPELYGWDEFIPIT